jgi:hypothetical protein
VERGEREAEAALFSTTTMDDVLDWIIFYPHPDYARGVLVTTPNPYPGRIGQLWKLAKAEKQRNLILLRTLAKQS